MRTFRELGANLQNGRLNLSVWAPLLEKLTYHPIKGKEEEMQKDGEYFNLVLEDCRDGDLYLFKNGDKLLPDPLSRFQPEGVDGPSMLVELSGYNWSANKWISHSMKDLIIYEMHMGTFTQDGTYRSAEAKLPYLRKLGINAIEIMPSRRHTEAGTGVMTAFFHLPHHIPMENLKILPISWISATFLAYRAYWILSIIILVQ
jgi:1,4-alpha-glucan branching enzyme